MFSCVTATYIQYFEGEKCTLYPSKHDNNMQGFSFTKISIWNRLEYFNNISPRGIKPLHRCLRLVSVAGIKVQYNT